MNGDICDGEEGAEIENQNSDNHIGEENGVISGRRTVYRAGIMTVVRLV